MLMMIIVMMMMMIMMMMVTVVMMMVMVMVMVMVIVMMVMDRITFPRLTTSIVMWLYLKNVILQCFSSSDSNAYFATHVLKNCYYQNSMF
jgi:hypothetical protein